METFKRTLGIGDGRVADFKTCSRQSDVYLYTYCRGAALPDAGWPGRWVAGLSCGALRVQLQRASGRRGEDDTARRRATERGGRRASRRDKPNLRRKRKTSSRLSANWRESRCRFATSRSLIDQRWLASYLMGLAHLISFLLYFFT